MLTNLRADLLRLLSRLPGLNDVLERKAFVSFTGYSCVGLYLDWSGSQVAFAEALIHEISCRGQRFTATFLCAARQVPQVGPEVAAQLEALAGQIKMLRPDEWLNEFPVETLTSQEHTVLVADLDMLAAAVVSSTLLPYYALGADALETQAGLHAVQVAKVVDARVATATATSRLARSVFDRFIQRPAETEGDLLALLRDLLDLDNQLVRDLAEYLTTEPQRQTATLEAMVTVAQNIRKVQGSVVGVIVGVDVVDRVAHSSSGSIADVHQTVEVVEPGGAIVGTIFGGEAGAIQVGGQQQIGDEVHGGKTQVDTRGAAYIEGNASSGGGDIIGRDKHVGGDEVHGSKVTGGKIGVGSIGQGAGSVVIDQLTVIQSDLTPDVEASPIPLIEEAIRLDVAAPRAAQLGEPFDIAVAVRQPDAPTLAFESLTEVTSGEGSIFRKEEDEVIKYRIDLTALGCEVVPSHYILKLRPRTNSRPCIFQVTAHRPGKRVLLVSAYQEDEALAAQTRVHIEIEVPIEPHA